MTDHELLDSYRSGDIAAFEAILERYERPLLRYVHRYRPEAAQDVVQDVFLRLVREASSLNGNLNGSSNGIENLSAWLYRVARNLAIDEVRKEERMQKRHQAVAVSEVQPPASTPVERREVASAVAARMGRLPRKQRDVLILKLQEEKSYREISAITGLTVSNVGYLIHQGLKTLAGELRRAGVV